jgi:D-alanine--poly(phosphoribitol) ligase subunit 1
MKSLNYIYNLGQLFSLVANENANNIAIMNVDGVTISYKELDELSNSISHYLSQAGIHKKDVVAIFNNKSFKSFAIMLACLKSGIIYTNIDPGSPLERLNKILEVCKPTLIFFSGEANHSIVQNLVHESVVDYDLKSFDRDVTLHPTILPELNDSVNGTDPAYIMFTSGSTGFPKGVLISHSSISNFIKWTVETFKTSSSDVFTNLNPMHFDNSVFDFYASLFTGASILPVTEQLTKNPRKLLDVLNQFRPTIWFSVPSMLVYMLNVRSLKNDDLPSLKIVTFGGEGFPKNKLRELWSIWGNHVRFINVYGPTECTCICSSYDVNSDDLLNDDLLPLGPIAPNFSAFVLDDKNLPIKDGEIGELCIGGPNVGIGYYNDSQRTNDVFISNPVSCNYVEKIYKTGDLVCYDYNLKTYIFKGRKDNQVKRMGYRIELEEIENAFNSMDFINEAAVVFIDNELYQSKIIACLVSRTDDKKAIILELTKYLPRYMLPDIIDFYDNLPKNQNGKINRLSLKENYIN